MPVDAPLVEVCRVGSVEEAIRDLGRRGVRRVLCEGGPTLNAALFEAGLVDEVFLTIAPKLVGGQDPLTIVKGGNFGTLHLELRSLVEIEGELFLRSTSKALLWRGLPRPRYDARPECARAGKGQR